MPARTSLALAMLATALVTARAAGPPCQLSMTADHWPPYLDAQSGPTPSGLDWDLLQAILQEAHCTVQLLPALPTARRQNEFQHGRIDLQLAASENTERRRYARFSLPYRHETVGIYSLASQAGRFAQLGSLDALAQRRLPLLAPKVGWYGPAYARVLPLLQQDGKLSTFLSDAQGVRMLAAGRADLILGDGLALRHAAQDLGVVLSPLPYTLRRAPVHLMLNRASTTPAQLDALNAAIARLERQGVLAQIRSRYGD
ncbi:MAG: substrate-binding periplasmic protein [Sphingomonadaceae bacterium]